MWHLFLAGLVATRVVAGQTASTNAAWSVRIWQTDDGLPNGTVTGLAQTSDGYHGEQVRVQGQQIAPSA